MPIVANQRFLESLSGVHEALLAGNGGAVDDAASLVYAPLLAYLILRQPRRDSQFLVDAVGDAVMEYTSCPAKARARNGRDAWAYLRRSAWCNVIDSGRKQHRRALAEGRCAAEHALAARVEERRDVELFLPDAKIVERDEDDSGGGAGQAARLEGFARTRNAEDVPILRLMQRGEWRTPIFAKAMGIAGQPVAEQRCLVKKAKDRLKKAISRYKG